VHYASFLDIFKHGTQEIY